MLKTKTLIKKSKMIESESKNEIYDHGLKDSV